MKISGKWAILAILALALILSACGGTEGTPGAEQPPAGGETAGPVSSPEVVILATPTPKPAPPTPTNVPAPPTAEVQAAETVTATVPTVAEVMVDVAAGKFLMGQDKADPEDAPQQEVDLAAYKIDKFEVTNADYGVFVAATGYKTYAEEQGYQSWRDEYKEGKERHPVVMVNWSDAEAYCKWLGKRLPTEAEWEKAARGEDGRKFPWGNDWDANKANVKERGLRGTAAVGSFGAGASPYGAEDMTGNVWEWTADWYQAYPGNTAKDQYYGEKFRVTRGCGWFDVEAQCTAYNRNAAEPVKTAIDELGFRCAR